MCVRVILLSFLREDECAAPLISLSYILFTPGSYQVQPHYYNVGYELLHLEQLEIQQVHSQAAYLLPGSHNH